MVDPRGSGLLFFMFIRPHPYTCLGTEAVLVGAYYLNMHHACGIVTNGLRAGSKLH